MIKNPLKAGFFFTSFMSHLSRLSRPDIPPSCLDSYHHCAGPASFDWASVFHAILVIGGGKCQHQAKRSARENAKLECSADHVCGGSCAQLCPDAFLGHMQVCLTHSAECHDARLAFPFAMKQQDAELFCCQPLARAGYHFIADDHVRNPFR